MCEPMLAVMLFGDVDLIAGRHPHLQLHGQHAFSVSSSVQACKTIASLNQELALAADTVAGDLNFALHPSCVGFVDDCTEALGFECKNIQKVQ